MSQAAAKTPQKQEVVVAITKEIIDKKPPPKT